LSLIAIVTPARADDNAKAEGAKIIEAYVKAAGGSRAFSQIQTLSLQGTVAAQDGAPGTYTLDTKLPNRYYSEVIVGGRHFIEAYNGKSAWRQNASGNPATMLSSDSAEMEAQAQIANSHFLNLKKNKLYATFIGHSQVQGKDALQVEITNGLGAKREFFFDPQSHLLLEESGSVSGAAEEIFYSDYRSEHGVQIAHKIQLHRGETSYSIGLTSATINGTLGERIFDLPMDSQVQLPDLKALFKEVDENQKAIDKLRENYAGTKIEEEMEYDSDGKMKKHTTTESTFFYLEGQEITTIVKKEGRPLPDADQKKEDENTRKRIEEFQKRQAKREVKEEKAKEEGKEQKDEFDVGIEMFLRTSQFVNPRRERFRGQDVLVFDFEGNPEYKPRNLAERIVQKLAGTIWVDEKAHDVARLQAYFVGDARIAGGMLANIQKGTSFVFEQEFINNEVWLPTFHEAHLGARVLMVKGFRMGEITHYSDYKRFHVETLTDTGSPKQQ
jgi:hypothetical protein